jgi:hypothetical protein
MNLAVRMRNLYPTWVGVDRALVVRTETLVCAKRLNCLEASRLRACSFTAERDALVQLCSGFVARKLHNTWADCPVARHHSRHDEHFLPVCRSTLGPLKVVP